MRTACVQRSRLQYNPRMGPSQHTRVATLLAALAVTNCAQNPVTGNTNLVLLTESQELARRSAGSPKDTRV